MKNEHFSETISVNESPEQVFDAINNVREWWSGQIDGETDTVGAEFAYRYKDLHRSTQRVNELVRGKKVVWHVIDAELTFVATKDEWKGTDIIFDISRKNGTTEIRFTHVGLKEDCECFEACSNGWRTLLTSNLRNLIVTRKAQPDAFA